MGGHRTSRTRVEREEVEEGRADEVVPPSKAWPRTLEEGRGACVVSDVAERRGASTWLK